MNRIRFIILLLLGIFTLLIQIDLKIATNVTALESIHVKSTTNPVFDAAIFYQKQCGFCHTKEELIGPDMNKIKVVYLKKYPKKADFVKAVSAFVTTPDKKIAIYKDGIDNFMDMPKMPFKAAEIKAVAAYIYDTSAFK